MTTTPESLDVQALAATYKGKRMLNVEALIATYDHIRRHPEEWIQTTWKCGTTYCYAGTVAAWFYGVRVNEGTDTASLDTDAVLIDLSMYEIPEEFDSWGEEEHQRGEKVHVFDFAGSILGLTRAEAADLFHANNTLDDIKRFIEEITGITLPA